MRLPFYQVEAMTKALHQQAQQESQASALTSERCELLNKECERYLNRAYAAERAAKDASALVEPLNERVRVLESEKSLLEAESTRKEGAEAHLACVCVCVCVCC